MNYLGEFAPGSEVYVWFNTFSSNDPSASVTATDLVDTDIVIYKDDSLTQRANTAGVAIDVDVDTFAGVHKFTIDTADNTVADFYEAGHDYACVAVGITVDAGTINACVATFSIANRRTAGQMAQSSIEALTDQNTFTLTTGEASADNDAYNDCLIIVTDQVTKIQKAVGYISDYTGATRSVQLYASPLQTGFTMAVGDSVEIFATSAFSNVHTVNRTAQTAGDLAAAVITNAQGADVATDVAAMIDGNNRVDVGSWLGQAVTLSTGNKPDVNVDEISDDTTAPGNLELMYDGTGYAGGTTKLDVNVASEDNIDFGATKKASINTEVDNSMVTYGLDHLLAASVTGTDVTDNSIVAKLVDDAATADWDGYDPQTASLEALNVDTDAIVEDTGTTLDGRIPAALVGGRMDANASAISGVAATADRLEAWMNGFLTGTVEEGGGPTTTVFQTDAGEATNDHFNNSIVVFTGGNLLGQARRVSDYVGATGTMTVEPALTEAPAAADTWIIFPMVIGGIDSAGRVDVGRILGTAQTAGDVTADTASILLDTDELQGDWANAGRLDAILDSILAMLDDARGEPGQGAPPVNPDMATKVDYIYKFLRNKVESTATLITVYNDDGTTAAHKSTVSDDATTHTRGEFVTGA
jgi:hypothetical protein